jgi:hypothetical protein
MAQNKFFNSLRSNVGSTIFGPLGGSALNAGYNLAKPAFDQMNTMIGNPFNSNAVADWQSSGLYNKLNASANPQTTPGLQAGTPPAVPSTVTGSSSYSGGSYSNLALPQYMRSSTQEDQVSKNLALLESNYNTANKQAGMGRDLMTVGGLTGIQGLIARDYDSQRGVQEKLLSRLQANRLAENTFNQQNFDNNLAMQKLRLAESGAGGRKKLSPSAQKEANAAELFLQQVQRLNPDRQGGYKGVGSFLNHPMFGRIAEKFGLADNEAVDNRTLLGDITGTIALQRGGTAFTPTEKALIETYTPKDGDSDQTIKSKLKGLERTMQQKLNILYGTDEFGTQSDGVDYSGLTDEELLMLLNEQ